MSVSVSVSDAGGGYAAVSYTTDAEANLHRSGGFCNISWAGGGTSLYGPSGSTTVYVGYYTTVNVQAGITYLKNTTNAYDHDEAASGSATTGGPPYVPPPAAPATPTLTGTSDTAARTMTLTWSNVGATFYDLYRDGVYLTRVYALTYADTPGGSTHTYYVAAANNTSGGTTYAGNSNTVTLSFIPPAGVNVRIGGAWVRKPLPKPRYIKLANGTWKLT